MNKTLTLAAAAVTILLASLAPATAAPVLTQIGRTNISNNFTPAFREASGLGVSKNQTALWSVTDQNCTVYQMGLDGSASGSFPSQSSLCPSWLGSTDFEGVTYAPPPAGITDDHYIYIANENGNSIVPFNYNTLQYSTPATLSSMGGYSSVTCTGGATVSTEFSGSDANSGLEGVTWSADYNSFFVIKEKSPGLILRISRDLTTILSCKRLTFSGGDYSDISYDPSRGRFWIVSDEAQAVFLYDYGTNSAVAGYGLGYSGGEGVAYNPSNHRLYIVTDNGGNADSYLYTYDVQ
jgi:uncharacterized protein YjiK